jgi:hypothetical protein
MMMLSICVQDIDFSRNEILVRDGKGAKDLVTMLPESLKAQRQEHLKRYVVCISRNENDRICQ